MSVNVGNRTPSKYEYINAYYKVDNDVLKLCQNIFGVDDRKTNLQLLLFLEEWFSHRLQLFEENYCFYGQSL